MNAMRRLIVFLLFGLGVSSVSGAVVGLPVVERFNMMMPSTNVWTAISTGNGRIQVVLDEEKGYTTNSVPSLKKTAVGGISENTFVGNKFSCTNSAVLRSFSMTISNNVKNTDYTFYVYGKGKMLYYSPVASRTVSVSALGNVEVNSGILDVSLIEGRDYILGVGCAQRFGFYYKAFGHPAAMTFGSSIAGCTYTSAVPPASWIVNDTSGNAIVMDVASSTEGVLRMDSSVTNSMATNALTVTVNLAANPSAILSFRHRENSDETDAGDGVFISTNGTSWLKVVDTALTNYNWHTVETNLSLFASARGMTLSSQTQIKFQQVDNYPWDAASTDGQEFDDIIIYSLPDLNYNELSITNSLIGDILLLRGTNEAQHIYLKSTVGWRGSSNALASIPLSYQMLLNNTSVLYAATSSWSCGFSAYGVETNQNVYTLDIPAGDRITGFMLGFKSVVNPWHNPAELSYQNNSNLMLKFVSHYSGTLYFNEIRTDITVTNLQFYGDMETEQRISGTGVWNGVGFSFDHLPVIKNLNTLHYSLNPTATNKVYLDVPAKQSSGNVSYWFTNGIVLATNGARADIKVLLPPGMGVSATPGDPMLQPYLDFSDVRLSSGMLPYTVTNELTWYVAEESKPLVFEANGIIWQRSSNRFYMPDVTQVDYVHRTAEQMLEYRGEPYIKKSNGGYYRSIVRVSSSNYITCSSTYGARWDFDAEMSGGTNRAFSPYGVVNKWNSGYLDVYNDLVKTNSLLEGVDKFAVSYARKCPSDPCGYDATNIEMDVMPVDEKLYFTRRGGLCGSVTVTGDPGNGNVLWGALDNDDYAQSVETAFTNGSYFMPGHFSDAGMTVFDNEMDREASVILLSGVMPTNRWSYELHGTASETNGLADYSGINLRVSDDPREIEGMSIIAHAVNPRYPLTERSKYYLRYSGVSGIHEADARYFPKDTMKIYGYDVSITNYALSYLSNSNVGSRTEGSLFVPAPSYFTLDFEEMKFSCLGDLTRAEVSEESELLKLKYWNADIMPYAITFAPKGVEDCGDLERFLLLGVGTYCANVDEQLFGILGFEADGNLITPAFGHPDTGSRLSPPSVMTVDGPRGEVYTFYPVSEIYYNNHDYEVDSSRNGFISVAGALDVPFFENLMVQLHTSASTNSANAPIYMMGGWPTDGWEVNGADFFDATLFDTNNAAFPVGDVSLTDYQKGADGYRVRALRDWLGVVDLNYPLDYDANTRSFESVAAVTNNFIVLKTEHQVDYLSAENAELSFGLQYDGVPQINLANIAFEAVDEITGGASDIFSGALEKLWEPILDGVDSLDSLLSSLPQDLMGDVVDEVVDDVVDTLYQQLTISYHADPANYFSNNIARYIRGVGAPDTFNIRARFGMMMTGGAELDINLADTLTGYLDQIETMLNSFGSVGISVNGTNVSGLLHVDAGNYPVLEDLANNVLGALAADVMSEIGSEISPQLNELLGEMSTSLQTLSGTIDEMRSVVTNLKYRINVSAGLDIYQELNASIDTSVINDVCSNAAQRIEALFTNMAAIDIEFTSYSEEEMKTLLKNAIKDEFYACSIPTDISQIMREQVYDLKSSIESACDSVFARINSAIREVMSQYLSEIDDRINGMLGEVSDFVGSGQINGYAHINNDSLEELRLDAALQWKVPDDLNFNGYLIIREIQSGSPESCGGGSEKAKEVILGTDGMGIEWISDIKVDIMTKFTFKGDDWTPVGLAGSFEMVEGVIGFESFILSEFAAGAGFGLYENYISAAARAQFSSYEVAGGAFFGRACSLEPILLWDKDVEEVLGAAPFTGFYVYGEGWMPIVDWGCVFNIKAGVGAGIFMFMEGPTIGGKIFVGAEGEALCVVDVGGDITVVGSKSGDNFTMVGKGRIKGKAGKCPFCVKFKKTVKLTYKNGSWDADY